MVMEQAPVRLAKAELVSRLAAQDFGKVVRGLCEAYDRPDVLEIGGGAKPLFRPGA